MTRAVAELLEEQRAGQLRDERLWHNLQGQVRAQLAPDLQAALRRVLAAQQRQPQAASSYRSAAPSSYRSAASQPVERCGMRQMQRPPVRGERFSLGVFLRRLGPASLGGEGIPPTLERIGPARPGSG